MKAHERAVHAPFVERDNSRNVLYDSKVKLKYTAVLQTSMKAKPTERKATTRYVSYVCIDVHSLYKRIVNVGRTGPQYMSGTEFRQGDVHKHCT